jgi:hypothetical protein
VTDWYAPNQQAVRGDESGPAEEGGGGAPDAPPAAAPYDPGAHTVAEVQDYVTAHPGERSAILEAESTGKNRVSLIEWFASG